MNCHHCNSEIIDTRSKFCPQCGSEIEHPIKEVSDVTAEVPNTIELENQPSSEKIEPPNIEAINQTANEETQQSDQEDTNVASIDEQKEQRFRGDKSYSLNKYVLLLGATLMVIFLIGSAVFALTPNKSSIKVTNEIDSTKENKEESGVLKEIHMINEDYAIIPNKIERIQYYTYPDKVDKDKLKWQSSNPAINVNQSGYVTSKKPNEEGIITVSNEDGSIKAQSKVKVSSVNDAFFSTLEFINSQSEEQQKLLNLVSPSFPIGKRLPTENEDTAIQVFEKINKEISTYNLIQKQFVNAQTKNSIDADIYSDPATGDIRKIVTIEYIGDSLEITDYYYLDGKIYFIFKRNENYYRPVPAQQDFSGSRYFYDGDSLLKWREIERTPTNTYEKTNYVYNGDHFDWKKYEYKSLKNTNDEKKNYVKAKDDRKLQKEREREFLNREQRMLNAAYNLYNKVIESPNTTNITGYILDEMGEPMSDVTVKVFSEEYDLLVGETKADGDGFYSVQIPMNYGSYTVYVNEPGYVDTTIYDIDSNLTGSNIFQETVYMYPDSDRLYTIQVNLVNALDGSSLLFDEFAGDTRLLIRKGINNKSGPVEYESILDPTYSEIYNLSLYPGNYTAELIAPGYESNYFTISTIQDGMMVYSNVVPNINDNSVRIVLSWSSSPSDLDSHLFFPNNSHIAYYSREAENGSLDVDVTSGFGPETITINGLKDGTYKYYVADYSNSSRENYSSRDMSTSFAKIDVYTKEGLTMSFRVPRNKQGVIWHAFNISNGKIVPVQRIFNNIEDYEWWSSRKN